MDFFGGYAYLLQSSGTDVTPALSKLHGMATNGSQSLWKRFAATKTLVDFKKIYENGITQVTDAAAIEGLKKSIATITNYITEIKAKETDNQLKGLYNNF